MDYFKVIAGIGLIAISIFYLKLFKKESSDDNKGFYGKYESLVYSILSFLLGIYGIFGHKSSIINEMLPIILFGFTIFIVLKRKKS